MNHWHDDIHNLLHLTLLYDKKDEFVSHNVNYILKFQDFKLLHILQANQEGKASYLMFL